MISNFPRFLNLVHAYRLYLNERQMSEEQSKLEAKLNNTLTGALTTIRGNVISSSGRKIKPPSWWTDDEEASTSSIRAMTS